MFGPKPKLVSSGRRSREKLLREYEILEIEPHEKRKSTYISKAFSGKEYSAVLLAHASSGITCASKKAMVGKRVNSSAVDENHAPHHPTPILPTNT